MPEGPRMLDFRELPNNQGPTPLEKTLSAYSQKTIENRQNQRESDALADIYKQYQGDEENIRGQMQSIQTDSRLGPTAKVNTINQLLKASEFNQNRQKEVQKQQEVLKKERDLKIKEEAAKRQKESEEAKTIDALKKGGASDAQIELYKVSPTGGKTKLIEDVIETANRNKSPSGLTSPDIEDYDQGLTAPERVKRQDQRYSTQTPLVNKNSESLSGLEAEGMSINLLNELTDSGRVGEGLKSININPKTGDLLLPAAGTPEEQLFVKTVNDFTVKAKDSFGARVTNFELDRFMQRLPTLANSKEGRKLILRQMAIVNQINQIEKRAVQNVFDQYGVRNIDYADAENKARASISDQKEELRKEYLNLEQVAKKEDAELNRKIKEKTQPGYTAMRKPDGTIKQFPNKNIEHLEEKGYKRL